MSFIAIKTYVTGPIHYKASTAIVGAINLSAIPGPSPEGLKLEIDAVTGLRKLIRPDGAEVPI